MSALQQIKADIQALSVQDFLALTGWMTDQHLVLLAETEFEAPGLEAALMNSLDSPRHEINETFFSEVRARVRG